MQVLGSGSGIGYRNYGPCSIGARRDILKNESMRTNIIIIYMAIQVYYATDVVL